MGIDDKSDHQGRVQKLQTASHRTTCVFSESRMREICLSGFMREVFHCRHAYDAIAASAFPDPNNEVERTV